MPGSAMYVISEQAEAYLEAIARFVREVRDEEAAFESILATVLFTDIVGSTARQAELGDVRWHELISEHHHRIRGCLARYRGRELDTAGDGSSRRSTDRCARSGARVRSRRRSPHSAWSCAPGFTPASAGRSTGKSAGSRSRSAPG
jgi:class 3 adenylate cyclase